MTQKMQKIDADSPEAKSADLVAENIARLKALFPELVTEGQHGASVNVDVLKQLVGDQTVTDADEKYGLNWFGKRKARQLALTPSLGTLRPAPEESVDWDTTQNLMIEGDNLEVLKLLQKSYAGKVKLIYIDPPYNTGDDFVYKDDLHEGLKNYERQIGLRDSAGQKTSSSAGNGKSGGHFHTNWLDLMYPRLIAARDLLRKDGAVFISIDDNEAPRLRQLCDEILGEENFVAQLVWTQGRKSMAAQIAVNHEYCLIYSANREAALADSETIGTLWQEKKLGLDSIYAAFDVSKKKHGVNFRRIESDIRDFFRSLDDDDPAKAHRHYKHVDARGLYFAGDISQGTGKGGRFDILHPKTLQPCAIPSGGWRFGQDKLPELLRENRIHFGEDHTTIPCLKRYLKETEYEVAPSVFYRDGRGASRRLRDLFGEQVFDYPKDENILARFIRYVTSPVEDTPVCMDFFAGSGTFGHAIMAQNAEDRGERRYILVQLPTELDINNKDQKSAAEFCDSIRKPRTIAEITKERLRRAGAKIKAENPDWKGDTGFRVFKLDSSNLRAWDPDRNNLEQTLLDHAEHVKPDRTENDLLYELLLKLGLDLCVPIEKRHGTGLDSRLRGNDGLVVHSVGGGVLMACLAADIGRNDVEALAQGIVTWHKEQAPVGETTCVFRDSAFPDEASKANLTVILEQGGIKHVRSL